MIRSVFQAIPFCRIVLTLAMLGSSLLSHAAVLVADDGSNDVDFPLLVVNVASLQRLRDNAGTMFESAERKEMTDVVDQWTADTLKETKGIDRSRPFGMMLYLSSDFPPRPLGISYIPVSNLDETLQTLAYGTGTIVPVDGQSNQHEIRYSEDVKVRTLYRNKYLFLVGPDGNDSSLDRNFPDPEKLTARLSSLYDISASFLIKSIPPGMKTLALEAVKSQFQADLQQRDDEPESVYRLRRANGEGWIDLLDKIVNQGNEITIGGRFDDEQKGAHIDVEIAGTKDSKLAKFFQEMSGKRTYFGNLLANPSTFTMSMSWLLEEKQRKLFVTYFEAAQRDLGTDAEKHEVSDLAKIVDPIFKTLMTSAEVGHLDAFAQLTGTEQGSFVLLAGAKLATSRNLPTQIEQLLQHVKDNPNGLELAQSLDLGVDAIDSHPVHRLPINPPGKEGLQMFGESSQLYLYSSPQAIWCAFGGDTALESLKQAIETVAQPQAPQQGRNRVPFQFVTHAKNWLSLTDTENPDSVSFTERARASFESDNDAMTVEIRPTDSGLRIRANFESGFISLMGRGISNGIDQGFFRGQQGRAGQDPNRGIPQEEPPRAPN